MEGSAFQKHEILFSCTTSLRFCRSWKHAFTVFKIQAKVSSTSSLTLENLNTQSVIHSTDYCSSLSTTYFTVCHFTLWCSVSLRKRAVCFSLYLSATGDFWKHFWVIPGLYDRETPSMTLPIVKGKWHSHPRSYTLHTLRLSIVDNFQQYR